MITSTDGLCVATIKCIPQALAFCAIRHIAVSTSFGATIIKSANSSIMITIWGSLIPPSCFSISSLYAFKSLTPCSANSLYLFSISCTAQLRAPAAFLQSVTTGINKCGIPLYPDNSTIFGSTSIILTSLGFALYSIETIIELIHTDLPEPVVPAISIWGILDMSPTHTSPAASFPSAKQILDLCFLNASESITSLKRTDSGCAFGISIPTAAFPGIGASILILFAAKFRAISSVRETILDTLTPVEGVNS